MSSFKLLHLNFNHANLTNPTTKPSLTIPTKPKSQLTNPSSKPTTNKFIQINKKTPLVVKKDLLSIPSSKNDNNSKIVVLGAMSLGLALFLMGFDDHNMRAMALGPEGPLLEDFWDNMRRYLIYALTVSTGALSVVVEPLFELLKNPISAVLIIVIIGGSFFIVSQIVTAMIGLSDFSYDYSY